MLQAEPAYRNTPADIQQIFVRTSTNQMVPLSSLLSVHMTSGPDIVQRFNLFRSAEITAAAAPGYSSGQALAAMEQVARTMPPEMGFDWAGVAYQERESSGGSGPIFALSFIFVFLFLAAQYESWVVPLAVLLGVPLGVLGAFLGIWMRGLINDVYVQIGVVMLIGLTAKNGILIVEFAKGRRESGTPLREAALEAARLRFRPIVMTSLAFIFGMLPLVIATGAGSGSRHSLGTAVFAGMISATVLEVFFVPAFFVAVEGLVERFRRAPHPSPAPPEPV
jgi:multidrug efflux pump subunit AcrB